MFDAKNPNRKEPHIFSMMLLSVFAVLGALVLTPSLPRISSYFDVSIGVSQLAVTCFLLGYAVGQLLYGPIANRYGRRPAFIVGIVLATLGSLFSILSSSADSFTLLVFGRFLEAAGSSAGLVVSITVINDFYTPKGVRQSMAWIMLAFSIMPGIAILLGGLFAQYLDWQACFYFLLAYGLFLGIPVWLLPETIEVRDQDALNHKHLLSKYIKAAKNKQLLAFGAMSGFSSALLYVYGAEGPFIGIKMLGLTAAVYGLVALTPYIGTLVGSLINSRLSDIDSKKIMLVGFAFELVGAVFMLIAFLWGAVSIYSMLILMALLCIGHSFLIPSAYSLAMETAEDKSNGSAVLGFVNMFMPVIITLLLGLLHVASAWIMPALFLVSLGLMALVYVLFGR